MFRPRLRLSQIPFLLISQGCQWSGSSVGISSKIFFSWRRRTVCAPAAWCRRWCGPAPPRSPARPIRGEHWLAGRPITAHLLGRVRGVGEAVVDGDVSRHVPHPEPGHHVQHAHLALAVLHLHTTVQLCPWSWQLTADSWHISLKRYFLLTW